jgi:hypothetical protein
MVVTLVTGRRATPVSYKSRVRPRIFELTRRHVGVVRLDDAVPELEQAEVLARQSSATEFTENLLWSGPADANLLFVHLIIVRQSKYYGR